MDPLSALRDYTIRGDLDKIHRAGTEFRFGADYTFPCTIDTAYRSKQGNLYTLETLIYFINNHHLRHTDYLQSARTRGIPAVTFIDRKPLLDYLHGRAASSDAIELFLPPQNAAVAAAGNDEYRPEEPQFLSVHSNAATGGAENDGFDVGVDLGSEVRVLETLDYTGLIRASERPLRDREEVLQCRNRDFYSVYISALKREEERQRVESHQRKDGLVAKNRLMAGEERGRGYREEGFDSGSKGKMLKGGKIGEGVPIILVPSASSTLITIYNVKEFLEDGVFIPMDVKMKQMKGPKPECVTVQKKFSRDRDKVVTAYEVRDKPSIMKPEDWDRVVAAFVLGKEWQFKDWPFKDHVEIFNKIIGFFMRFEDDSIESARNVKQWNVKIISISKNKRHQDRAAALEVWDKLEEFMRSRSHS